MPPAQLLLQLGQRRLQVMVQGPPVLLLSNTHSRKGMQQPLSALLPTQWMFLHQRLTLLQVLLQQQQQQAVWMRQHQWTLMLRSRQQQSRLQGRSSSSRSRRVVLVQWRLSLLLQQLRTPCMWLSGRQQKRLRLTWPSLRPCLRS